MYIFIMKFTLALIVLSKHFYLYKFLFLASLLHIIIYLSVKSTSSFNNTFYVNKYILSSGRLESLQTFLPQLLTSVSCPKQISKIQHINAKFIYS